MMIIINSNLETALIFPMILSKILCAHNITKRSTGNIEDKKSWHKFYSDTRLLWVAISLQRVIVTRKRTMTFVPVNRPNFHHKCRRENVVLVQERDTHN